MDWEDLSYFNERAEIDRTLNWLPHWHQLGCAYFITFRLADALPQILLDEWQRQRTTWIDLHPEPWTEEIEEEYHRRFTTAIQRWLDEGHGACIFRRELQRQVMDEALRFFEGKRCSQIAWVIMPNHVHALTALLNGERIGGLIQSWKRHTAREINRRTGHPGTLWQKDYHDRLIRDPGHLMNCVRYIRRNPQNARLQSHEYTHWESDFAKGL